MGYTIEYIGRFGLNKPLTEEHAKFLRDFANCYLMPLFLKRAIRIKQMFSFFSSVAQSCPTLRPHGLQHTGLPCPSPTPGVC